MAVITGPFFDSSLGRDPRVISLARCDAISTIVYLLPPDASTARCDVILAIIYLILKWRVSERSSNRPDKEQTDILKLVLIQRAIDRRQRPVYFRSAINKSIEIGSHQHDQLFRLKPVVVVIAWSDNGCLSSSTFHITGSVLPLNKTFTCLDRDTS